MEGCHFAVVSLHILCCHLNPILKDIKGEEALASVFWKCEWFKINHKHKYTCFLEV